MSALVIPFRQTETSRNSLPSSGAASYFPPSVLYDRGFLFSKIDVDAETFQFKVGRDIDDKGVSDQLRSVQAWDPMYAGTILVWQRRDEKLFIANGHQRLGLASRLKLTPQGKPIILVGHLVREIDGWTPKLARIKAALINIAEGGQSTKAVHVAMIIRDGFPEELFNKHNITRARLSYRLGVDIAKLEPRAFRSILNEEYPERYGAAVGQKISGEADQLEALRVVAEFRPNTEGDLHSLVDSIREQGFVTDQISRQESLFDDEDQSSRSIFFTYVRILNEVLKGIDQDARWARETARRPELFHRIAHTAIDLSPFSQEADTLRAAHFILKRLGHQKGEFVAAELQTVVQNLYQVNINPTADDIRKAAHDLKGRLYANQNFQSLMPKEKERDDLIKAMQEPDIRIF